MCTADCPVVQVFYTYRVIHLQLSPSYFGISAKRQLKLITWKSRQNPPLFQRIFLSASIADHFRNVKCQNHRLWDHQPVKNSPKRGIYRAQTLHLLFVGATEKAVRRELLLSKIETIIHFSRNVQSVPGSRFTKRWRRRRRLRILISVVNIKIEGGTKISEWIEEAREGNRLEYTAR